jgi:putative transposase
MPKGPNRVYGKGHLHFITCYCYLRQRKLAEEKHRNLFVQLLEEIRTKFHFGVVGYVVMLDHFHLLMVEPATDTAAKAIETLLQRYQRRYNTSARIEETAWQLPYADAHIFQPEKVEERLNFMHRSPVKEGLVDKATDWDWSSARFYAGMPEGVVTIERATLGPTDNSR